MRIMEGNMDQVIYQSLGASPLPLIVFTTTAATPSWVISTIRPRQQLPSANGTIEYDWTGGPLMLIGPESQKLLS